MTTEMFFVTLNQEHDYSNYLEFDGDILIAHPQEDGLLTLKERLRGSLEVLVKDIPRDAVIKLDGGNEE